MTFWKRQSYRDRKQIRVAWGGEGPALSEQHQEIVEGDRSFCILIVVSLWLDAFVKTGRTGRCLLYVHYTAGPRITLFHVQLIRRHRNFTLIYINQPLGKLVLLPIASPQLQEPTDNVKWGLYLNFRDTKRENREALKDLKYCVQHVHTRGRCNQACQATWKWWSVWIVILWWKSLLL